MTTEDSILDAVLEKLNRRLSTLDRKPILPSITALLETAVELHGDAPPESYRAWLDARIRASWSTQPTDLIWMEDKLEQVANAQQLTNSPHLLHLPDYLSPENISGEWIKKPRNGHDGIGVTKNCRAEMEPILLDKSWGRERGRELWKHHLRL